MMIVLAIFGGFAILEMIFTRFWSKKGQQKKDGIVELVGTVSLTMFTQPMIIITAIWLMGSFFPQYENVLSGLGFLPAFVLFLLFDDLTQYWWHRFSHSNPVMYHLHRPHHDASYMSVRIVYRNNLFYYAMMPGLWFDGILIFMGLGHVYAFYVILKLTVIIAAHSDVRWDEPLYKIKWLSPVMWLVERLISTPATHSAHHGKHKDDGVTYYKGNYGNLLFLWDIIFGTAKITRKYPTEFGVEDLPEVGVGEQLFWPLVRSKSDAK